MISIVRRLVSFLQRWLAKYDKHQEHKQLPPAAPDFFTYDIDQVLRVARWKPLVDPPFRNKWDQIVRVFGNPDWVGIPGSAKLKAGPGTRKWKREHMVLVYNLPGHDRWSAKGLKKLYVNKAIVAPLTEALARCVALQDEGHIPADWDLYTLQCFNPRRIGYAEHANWSGHAYGAAVDINPRDNRRGVVGKLPEAVAKAFKSCWFFHGRDYRTVKKDAMHMEWWR